MKTYKITYNSRAVLNNKFVVDAENKKEAKQNFKTEYIKLGGNWSNIKSVVFIEEVKQGEDLNEFFKR